MNNAITTYDSLKEEEQRLLSLLKTQKEVIKADLRGIREELDPVLSVASTVLKFTTYDPETSTAVKVGTNLTIDWIMQKVFPRSGFLMRMLLPTVLKNYTSHYVSKATPVLKKIGNKISGLVNHR